MRLMATHSLRWCYEQLVTVVLCLLSTMAAETILVTGANGFVAMHIIRNALDKGWTVIGTVRSAECAAKVVAAFPNAREHLVIERVDAITKSESFNTVFTSHGPQITAIVNAAGAPPKVDIDDQQREIIDPAIAAVKALLEAVEQHYRLGNCDRLRRFVHISSTIALADLSKGDAPGCVYDCDTWNPLTYEDACAIKHPLVAYAGAKTLSEKAAWDFVKSPSSTRTIDLDLVAMVPASFFGPHSDPSISMDELLRHDNSRMLWDMTDNRQPTGVSKVLHDVHMGSCVDVRDAAQATLLAIETPEAGGQRIVVGQRTHWQFVRDAARRVSPQLAARIDPGTPGAGEAAKATTYDLDGTKVTTLLGMEYTPMETALKDAYEQLLDAEKRQAKQV
jgi:NADPH-dependent methylglyoxal reductase